ncbi:hypothetical protein [Paracidovorax avenae]|nr:hypothetical protein [Paracidovorax avenae]
MIGMNFTIKYCHMKIPFGYSMKWLLVAAVSCFGLFVGIYIAKPEASQIFVDTCAAGPYRVEAFQYKSGAGFVQLVDGNGKLLDRSDFSESAMVRPRWSQDCKSVSFGSDTDPEPLAVRP